MPKFERPAGRMLGFAAATAALVVSATLASAQAPATIAEADGKGKVNVKIVYYADQGCTTFAGVREGAPGNIQPPTRTLVVTVTLDRKKGECVERPYTIEHTIAVSDRPDALSVDIFYVDPAGRFVRSQRPRIYRDLDTQECAAKDSASKPC